MLRPSKSAPHCKEPSYVVSSWVSNGAGFVRSGGVRNPFLGANGGPGGGANGKRRAKKAGRGDEF